MCCGMKSSRGRSPAGENAVTAAGTMFGKPSISRSSYVPSNGRGNPWHSIWTPAGTAAGCTDRPVYTEAKMRFDYIIAGSGIAGLYAALLAREHGSLLVLTKGSMD